MSDKSSRTEKPTPRRIQKAREEGHFLVSRQLLAAMQFLLFIALLTSGLAEWLGGYKMMTRAVIGRAFSSEITVNEFAAISRQALWTPVAPLVAGGILLTLAVLGIQLAITQGGISTKKLGFNAQRLNPLSTLREMPRRNIFAALQALVMLPLFLYAVYAITRENLPEYSHFPVSAVPVSMAHLGVLFRNLLWKAGGLFLIFGVVEYVRERRHYMQEMRMSKQDLRDEAKESEGNPQVKSRLRKMQRELARHRMIRRVPEATAVIVNPTHFAVALRYDVKSMKAPVAVAKGVDDMALRIRRVAQQHGVPIVENPPLARALYQSVDIGQEIPLHLYRAVAEVLAYIHKLLGVRAAHRN